MIGGKKIRKPLRKLKIQEHSEMDEELTPDFIDDNEELNLLSAINCIVTLAEDSELSTLFFEKADRFITYLSERLGITKIQAVLPSSSNRVPLATSLIFQMLHVTLTVTTCRCYNTRARLMNWSEKV